MHVATANKSAALNAVLETLSDEFLLFLDDDVRLAPETVAEYAVAARGKDGGTYFGGPTGVDYEQPPPEWLKSYLPVSAVGWTIDGRTDWLHVKRNDSVASSRKTEVRAPNLLGFNWAAFARDLKTAGGFDPRRGPGGSTGAQGQDTAMQIRLLEEGANWEYLPRAMVWHYVPRERCSPQWALDRSRKVGIASGLDMKPKGPVTNGYPRWMIRPYLRKLASFVFSRLHPVSMRRFEAARDLAYFRGVMEGAREAIRRSSERREASAEAPSRQEAVL
jgi:glycosyltransferase involved in cell wall biosynthesis